VSRPALRPTQPPVQ